MTPTTPFFVIRNSIHNVVDGVSVGSSNSSDGPKHNDEDSISHHEQQTHVSIVRLVEAPGRGMYLDFCSEADQFFIKDFIEDSDETRATYIVVSSWRHLHTFATLIGKDDALSCHPTEESFRLPGPSSEDDTAPCLTLLKEDVVAILREVLPLDRIFSWHVLVDARKHGDLKWKEIRALLAAARENTKEGRLQANEVVNLTFLQFVTFSKMVESHLSVLARTLPLVSCRVLGSTSMSVDVQLESNHNCIVQMGALAADASPPTTADLQNHCSMFTSWSAVKLNAGAITKVKVDPLAPNTAYHIYLRIEKYSHDGGQLTVASSDDDVLRSRVDVVTDCQTDIFPAFSSMTLEEQKTELLAVVNDHSVRQEAPVIPHSKDELVSISECSSDWNTFIQWWVHNHVAMSKFLMRELSFAASDKEISREAERNGICMNNRKSSNPKIREVWSKLFAAWYFGMDISEPRRVETKEVNTTTAYTCPVIQNYQFETADDKAIYGPHNMSGFLNRVWQASSVVVKEETLLHGDESRPPTGNHEHESAEAPITEQTIELVVDMNITSVQPKTLTLKSRAPPLINETAVLKEQKKQQQQSETEASVSSVGSRPLGNMVGLPSKLPEEEHQSNMEASLNSADAPLFINEADLSSMQSKKQQQQSNKEAALNLGKQPKKQCWLRKEATTTSAASGNSGGRDLGIGSGIAGEKITSHRKMLLYRVTKKVHAARIKAEELTGNDSKLRGVELFRAKVRLVMLLNRIAPPGTNSTEINVERTRASARFDLFEFDDTIYNFDALKRPSKVEEASRFDLKAFKELRHRIDFKLARRAFDSLLNWKNSQSEMQANVNKADVAYRMTLARRTFLTFQDNVSELKMERGAIYNYKSSLQKRSFFVFRDLVMRLKKARLTKQNPKQSGAIKSDFAIRRTPSFETKQLSYEDEISSKFRASCRSRFGIDPSPFAVELKPWHSRLNHISRAEYEEFFAHGIELRNTRNILGSTGEPLMLFDQDTLRQLKQEKLKASSNSGVNIFDVPTDVLMSSCRSESNQMTTDYRIYRMREKVKCLAELES